MRNIKEETLEFIINKGIFFVDNKKIRRFLINKIEEWICNIADKAYDENYNRPKIVYEQRRDMGIALLESFDRVFPNLSKNVKRKFFENFILNYAIKGYKTRRKFLKEQKIYPPGFVTISPTNICNLRCKGCYAGDIYTPHTLSFEIFDWTIEHMKKEFGSYFVVISGGEPFMYKDKKGKTLVDILEKHNDVYFMAYTNGTMINKETARKLSKLGNLSPAISLEGFEKETDYRRGEGIYKEILKVMDTLREEGLIFGISVTPTKYNAEILASDEFINYFLKEKGAMYMWMFQYMPIGRNPDMNLMITPRQRIEMYDKIWKKVKEEKLFIGDFWNSGMASDGCMAAARGGGYFYVMWDGTITPCVFIPFRDKNKTLSNVNELYKKNKTLTDAINSDFFKAIREWQDNYWRKKSAKQCGNLLMPCSIRDHSKNFKKISEKYAEPIDEGSKKFLYFVESGEMPQYNEELDKLTRPLWEKLKNF